MSMEASWDSDCSVKLHIQVGRVGIKGCTCSETMPRYTVAIWLMLSWSGECVPRNYSPHHYSPQPAVLTVKWIPGFRLCTPDSDPIIYLSQQKSQFVIPTNVCPLFLHFVVAMTCQLMPQGAQLASLWSLYRSKDVWVTNGLNVVVRFRLHNCCFKCN